MYPQKFEMNLEQKNKESISILINNYCLSITRWDKTCDLLLMDKKRIIYKGFNGINTVEKI